MSLPLGIAVAQPPVAVGDIDANIVAHADAIVRAQARLVVFPELSLTGYGLDLAPIDMADLAPIQEACAIDNTIGLVGAPTRFGSGVAISTVAVSGAGVEAVYHKMCLGEAEARHFVAGTDPVAIEIDGWRIGLGICKDTRIDEHLLATIALGVDAYAAGVVHARHEVAELAERAARIIDLAAIPVAFANAAGNVGAAYPDAGGGSAIWDQTGDLLEQASDEPGEVLMTYIQRFEAEERPA